MDKYEYVDAKMAMLRLDGNAPHLDFIDDLPEDSDGQAVVEYLLREGALILEDDGELYVNRERAAEISPDLLVYLDILLEAEVQEAMDNLENLGLFYSSTDEDGNMVYMLTEEGQKFANENHLF